LVHFSGFGIIHEEKSGNPEPHSSASLSLLFVSFIFFWSVTILQLSLSSKKDCFIFFFE
jgi:hypothetical protein